MTSPLPTSGVLSKPVPLSRFPLADASLAALLGVSVDDYLCHLIAWWGRSDPHRARASWRLVLFEHKVSVSACDRYLDLLGGTWNRQRMKMFFTYDESRPYYRARLDPAEVKGMARMLGLSPAVLAAGFRLPERFGLPLDVQRVEPLPLPDRLAAYVTGRKEWVVALRRHIRRRDGCKSGGVNVSPLSRALAAEVGVAPERYALGLLQVSQVESRRWRARELAAACRLLDWPLEQAAAEMRLPPVEPVRYEWPRLEALPEPPHPGDRKVLRWLDPRRRKAAAWLADPDHGVLEVARWLEVSQSQLYDLVDVKGLRDQARQRRLSEHLSGQLGLPV